MPRSMHARLIGLAPDAMFFPSGVLRSFGLGEYIGPICLTSHFLHRIPGVRSVMHGLWIGSEPVAQRQRHNNHMNGNRPICFHVGHSRNGQVRPRKTNVATRPVQMRTGLALNAA
jgi:hypothetical protein